MLFFDYSQIIIGSNIDHFSSKKAPPSLDQMRRVSLVSLFSLKHKLKKYYRNSNDIYLCVDSKSYWRKGKFKYYKSHRKKNREESEIDWATFYEYFNIIKEEFKSFLPFHLIEVEGAEADDVITVLSSKFCSPQITNVIISSDKDFLQIRETICSNIKQYSPWHKKFLTDTSQEYDLFSHIIRGDSGDGIPNILSDDDSLFNVQKRQRKITSNKLNQWRFLKPEEFCETVEILNNYKRNKQMIDLREIPLSVQEAIKNSVNSSNIENKSVFNYIVQSKLTDLLDRGIF